MPTFRNFDLHRTNFPVKNRINQRKNREINCSKTKAPIDIFPSDYWIKAKKTAGRNSCRFFIPVKKSILPF